MIRLIKLIEFRKIIVPDKGDEGVYRIKIFMSKEDKIYIARKFRKNQTKSEQIMWEELRDRRFRGLKFRRQYLMLGYIIDFYCPELKLACLRVAASAKAGYRNRRINSPTAD